MPRSGSSLQTGPLVQESEPQRYKLYQAAQEWDLEDPIVIDNRDDLKSRDRWSDKVEPYNHQVSNLITFCRRLPVTLLADDVGLGKTISAGLIASELASRGRVSRILIVCPKVLLPQWASELASKFDISSVQAIGSDLIDAEVEGDVSAVITTYNTARMYLDQIPDGRFDMLILDEAHKLRNLFGVEKPPQVAKRFKQALADRLFKYVLMLTATPIQNRLWDLYSLVDLLATARGHENPFGGEGIFARTYIADDRAVARQLRPESQDQFRSVIYGYMSRVRRDDAKLHFPERIVQMHKVQPTSAELEIITLIAKPIQTLNALSQISILQALVSSPQALSAQLQNMARNELAKGGKKVSPIPALAIGVKKIVDGMGDSAKLNGLATLISQLRSELPDTWRMVIFTTRFETQTTIQQYLESVGVKVGIVNGTTAGKNQETLKQFWADRPEVNVICSTEAGAEGVNLQVANILVNYDLPWNPMIVEQRIGRIQRLASKFQNVCIFNITLAGTFEEYIVGRLMEKLQMASHAIGDIDSLLETLDGDGDDDAPGFADRIRQLVVDALAGKDVVAATKKAEQSIADAKAQLEQEKANIDKLFGGRASGLDDGPKTPTLTPIARSMSVQEFTLAALHEQGAVVTEAVPGVYSALLNGNRSRFTFENVAPDTDFGIVRYAAHSPAFERLVRGVLETPLHRVEDLDAAPNPKIDVIANDWASSFGATVETVKEIGLRRSFRGDALVRVRAIVAHDSFERLVSVPCSGDEHFSVIKSNSETPLPRRLTNPTLTGVNLESVSAAAYSDTDIEEFCRFYEERRTSEIQAAAGDKRKSQKLKDDFTPRLSSTLTGLAGASALEVDLEVKYLLRDGASYASVISARPSERKVVQSPILARCAALGELVPEECLGTCAISQKRVTKHLLARSDISGREALPSHTIVCVLSNRVLLEDEAATSDITGNRLDPSMLKTCAISQTKAEPEYFDLCEFTGDQILKSEILRSEASDKLFRRDQSAQSVVSKKLGHISEFVIDAASGGHLMRDEAEQCQQTGAFVRRGELSECQISRKRVLSSQLQTSELSGTAALPEYFTRISATDKLILKEESERCAITGQIVQLGALQPCAISGVRVVPSELMVSAVSGQVALKQHFVSSSISGAHLIQQEAVRSSTGAYCLPIETTQCRWTGKLYHPDDVKICDLTGENVHFKFVTAAPPHALQPLLALLNGTLRSQAKSEEWSSILLNAKRDLPRGNQNVTSAELSPDNSSLALCVEVKTMLGLGSEFVGILYVKDSVVGRVVVGKRSKNGWVAKR